MTKIEFPSLTNRRQQFVKFLMPFRPLFSQFFGGGFGFFPFVIKLFDVVHNCSFTR